MAQQTNSNVAQCPECDGYVQLSGKLQIGQKLSCRGCGSALVIIERKPLELVLADGNHLDLGYPKINQKKDKDLLISSKKKISKHKESTQMSTVSPVLLADCPECNATLRFHRPLKERQLVVCPECDETLEVISLRPLELFWANEDPLEYEEYDNPRHQSRYGL